MAKRQYGIRAVASATNDSDVDSLLNELKSAFEQSLSITKDVRAGKFVQRRRQVKNAAKPRNVQATTAN